MNGCGINDSKFLDNAINSMQCFPRHDLATQKTINLGLEIELLLCENPTALDGDNETDCHSIANTNNLTNILTKIKCGQILEELEIEWAKGLILVKKLEACQSIYE